MAELIAVPAAPRLMVRCLFVLAVVLFAGAAEGQMLDPLDSVECRQALELLQAREAAVLAARQAGGPLAAEAALQGSRGRAAQACLGSRADSPPAPQRVYPPVVVPPIAVGRPAPTPRALSIAPTGPALRPAEPPAVVTACDAVGCWASDGSRLQRVGPNLLGPRGLCSVHGTLLHCP